MTDADKRQFVAAMYPSNRWKAKVAQMSDAQVFAIWKKEQDKLVEEASKPKKLYDPDDIPF